MKVNADNGTVAGSDSAGACFLRTSGSRRRGNSNAIAPGMVETKFSEPLWREPSAHEAIAKGTALDRLGAPEDIAGVALFLTLGISSYVTGVTLVVDGGALVGGPPEFSVRGG